MGVNFYQEPARAEYVSQYVPIPFDALLTVGRELNARRDQMDAKLDQFYKETGDFQSPSDVDMQRWNETTKKPIAAIAEQLVQNPEAIKNPEVQSLINRTVRNMPYAEMNKLKMSRDNMIARQKTEAKLAEQGRWNYDWHHIDYNNYDSSKNGVFEDINMIPYVGLDEAAHSFYSKIKPTYLATSDGYDIYGIDHPRVEMELQQNTNLFLHSPAGRKHLDARLREIQKVNPNATEEDAGKAILEEMRSYGSQYTYIKREANQYDAYDYQYKLKYGNGNTTGSALSGLQLMDGNLSMADREAAQATATRRMNEPVNENIYENVLKHIDGLHETGTLPDDVRETVKLAITESKSNAGKFYETINNLWQNGILDTNIVNEIDAAIKTSIARTSVEERNAELGRAVRDGNTEILSEFNRSKHTEDQSDVHALIGSQLANEDRMRVYNDNDLSPTSNAANVTRTSFPPGTMYTGPAGIPVTDISVALLNDDTKTPDRKGRKSLDIKDREIIGRVDGVLKYIMNKTKDDVLFSASGKMYKYTGSDRRSRTFAEGIQYMKKSVFEKIVKAYLKENDIKNVSYSELEGMLLEGSQKAAFRMLFEGQRDPGFVIGKIIKDAVVTSTHNGVETKFDNEGGDMVGLYVTRPIDIPNLPTGNVNRYEANFGKGYNAATRTKTIQANHPDMMLTPEEQARPMSYDTTVGDDIMP